MLDCNNKMNMNLILFLSYGKKKSMIEKEEDNSRCWWEDRFECDTSLEVLKEEQEADAFVWSEDGFEYDTVLDMLNEEEDADACLWSEERFECVNSLVMW